ncbi:hypothetical protein OEZ85_008376 [Tetradesmus obliquus]|uniref:Uncharacterized protein n=1 Tax=Tetradesmus obliquus TaxID=3088 RepID=A0ABY8TKY3_TETOB|nr:hypothetical protein OEZ85_008376 [Tetradesmus obliquus]
MKLLPIRDTDRHWSKEAKLWLVLASARQQVAAHLAAAGFVLQQEGQGPGDAAAATGPDLLALEASEARLLPLLGQEEAEETALAANLEPQWSALLPHQREGVLAGLRRAGRLLLADEMGLGKTAQAILLACCYPEDWPLLLVVPASLRGVWGAELGAWLPPAHTPHPGHIQTARSGEELRSMLEAGLPATRKQVLLLTYDLAKQLPPNIAARFSTVICDESHHLKNKDAQRTQAVTSLVRGARRAVLLTGTPLLSRPIEAWSQVDMLRENLLGKFEEFGAKYCTPEGEQASSPAAGSGRGYGSGGGRSFPVAPFQGCNRARLGELHRLLLANVMVRRTKAQVGLGLPSKTRLRVAVGVDAPGQQRLACIRAGMQRLAEAGGADSAEGKRLVNEYRQATGEAKVAAVVELIKELPGLKQAAAPDADEQQQGGNGDAGSSAAAAAGTNSTSSGVGKIVVFAYHQQVLNALQAQLCETQGLGFIRIDGSTPPQQRQQLVDRFQTDPSVRLALLSIKAAGAGLTLTAADRVVFAELHWNPSDHAQCEDRIHRSTAQAGACITLSQQAAAAGAASERQHGQDAVQRSEAAAGGGAGAGGGSQGSAEQPAKRQRQQ